MPTWVYPAYVKTNAKIWEDNKIVLLSEFSNILSAKAKDLKENSVE